MYDSFSEEVLTQVSVKMVLFQFTGMTTRSIVGVKFKENFKFYISVTIYHFEHLDQISSSSSSF